MPSDIKAFNSLEDAIEHIAKDLGVDLTGALNSDADLTNEQRLAKFEETIIEIYDPTKRTTPHGKLDAEISRDLQLMLAQKHEVGHDKYGLASCTEVTTVEVACLMKALGSLGSILVDRGVCSAQDLADYVVASVRRHNGDISAEEFTTAADGLAARTTQPRE